VARADINIGQVVEMLTAQIVPLVEKLLHRGKRVGQEYCVDSLAGEPGRALSIRLTGAKAGVWKDFRGGDGGDALDLVAGVLFRGDKKQAFKWALNWLGLENIDPAQLKERRRQVEVRAAGARLREEEDAAKVRRKAFAIWLSASETLRGTLADVYLKSRGLDLSLLGKQPRSLRFAGGLWNGESGREWPCLVAAIMDAQGQPVAIHRTWLALGGAAKAPLNNAKMTLGRYMGGSIRIWRGAGGLALSRADGARPVVLTEGIEDALSVALACPELRVLCAVSLANMAHVALPDQVRTLIICADNDGDNAAAARGLGRAVEAHQAKGREVRIARSPVGKDFNDLLRAPISGADGAMS
jgi:hypothetical protein